MGEMATVVVLTPGRSGSSTYLHLKWASQIGNAVLVLAGCRTQESLEVFAGIADDSMIDITQHRSWAGETDHIVSSMMDEIKNNPDITTNTRISIVFAGGKKSIYLQLYHELCKNRDFLVDVVDESQIRSEIDFTIEEWMHINTSDMVVFNHEHNELHLVDNESTTVLSNLAIGRFENPTRLYAHYCQEFRITSEMTKENINEELKTFRKSIRKGIEKLNMILVKNSLTTDIRIEPQIIVSTPYEKIQLYCDPNFLSRSLFLSLVLEREPFIEFHNANPEIARRFTILRTKLFSKQRRKKLNKVLTTITQINHLLSDVVNINLGRIDNMKWLIRKVTAPIINFNNDRLVTDGFNGRELAKIVKSYAPDVVFQEGKDLIKYSGNYKMWVSAFIMSLNVQHYLSISDDEFNAAMSSFNYNSLEQISDDFSSHEKLIILGFELKGQRKIPHYRFKLDNKEQEYCLIASDFCEFLYALAKNTQTHEQLFENLWSCGADNHIKSYNDLLKVYGISNKRHVIDADGYGLIRHRKRIHFEISDVHCSSEYNSERVLDKYEKYEKMASNFPYPIYNTVFSVFNRPSEDDLEKEKNRIIPFIEQGKNRFWKFLDLSQVSPESELQIEIHLKSLGKFLFDVQSEFAIIYNFEEWCYMTKNDGVSFRLESEEE